MRFDDLTADEFRTALHAFVEEHHPGPSPKGAARLAYKRAWAATLFDHGFAGPSWPVEHGGMSLSLDKQLIYHQTMARAGTPSHPQPNNFIVAPTIMRHGTDAQRDRFLRPALRADELWCQGWSEPGAGSDLPMLSTRAVRDGDHYVVTGQKVWTTGADFADWMFALVRTGPPGQRQDGISYLLVDMRSPGITVRPIRDMSGRCDFAETFLDEVRVPVENLVGDEGGGWAIARTSFRHERATAFISTELRYREIVHQLTELARRLGRLSDAVVRQEVARLHTDVELLALNSARVLAQVLAGEEPGPASSVSRLQSALFERRLHEVALDLTGAHGLLDSRDPEAIEGGRWAWGFLTTRGSTIGAGTSEIHRNTVAERVLGLPAEPVSAHQR